MPAAVFNRFLEEVQLAQEANWGDAAAPTIALGGVTDVVMTPKIESSQIVDKRANSMPAHIAAVNRISGEAAVTGVVTYTQFEYLLNAMFALDAATPHAYLAALTPVAPVTWNLLYGQPNLCYSMAGALMDKLVIRGNTNGPLTYQAHLLGKAPVADVREALAIPALEIAMGGQTAVAIDAATVAFGSTPLTLTGMSFELTIQNTRRPVWHLGTLNPDNYGHGKWAGGLHLVLEMTVATKAYLTAAIANITEPDSYNIRLTSTGTAPNVLTLDMAGHLLASPVMFTDQDGVTTIELDYSPAYDSAIASCFAANLITA